MKRKIKELEARAPEISMLKRRVAELEEIQRVDHERMDRFERIMARMYADRGMTDADLHRMEYEEAIASHDPKRIKAWLIKDTAKKQQPESGVQSNQDP